jgi:hypothetical protein
MPPLINANYLQVAFDMGDGEALDVHELEN